MRIIVLGYGASVNAFCWGVLPRHKTGSRSGLPASGAMIACHPDGFAWRIYTGEIWLALTGLYSADLVPAAEDLGKNATAVSDFSTHRTMVSDQP
jgi:hypothetical protein